MTKEKITANQFFLLLYLSLLNTVFMYLSSQSIKISQTDAVLRPIFFVAISFVVFVPTFLVLKRHINLRENRQYIKESLFLKIIAVIYAVVYFVSILKTVARFDLFVSIELFPNADMTIFIVLIVGVCAVLSFLGIGALGRAATVFAFLVVASTIVVMASLTDEIDFLNFTPLFENGIIEFSKECLLFACQATEIGAIVMLMPEIKGDIKKTFKWWSVLSGISISVIFFFVIGVLGSFADTQLFPTYTAVTLASFGLLERIDALETAIWIFCVVEKLALFFFVVTRALKYSFKNISEKIIAIAVTGVVSIIMSIVSYDITKFRFLSSDILAVALFIIVTIILPVCLYVYMKRVKPVEKYQESI